ncbi:hypothetical protein [Embleya sp. NPDC020886]|uniref:hypothetical protein n=1 Tax=Embleya sp. NPDC020886 TaxID=3363980 RepID=UPI0037B026D9
MTGLELILAALAAGAGAGVSDTAGNAIRDAYTGLRGMLLARFGSGDRVRQALEAAGDDPDELAAQVGPELVAAGADTDEEVLTAARGLLGLLDPEGARAGVYTVTVQTNYGAAGTFTAPVTISYGQPPVPPPTPDAG